MYDPGEAVECVDDTPAADGRREIPLKRGKIYRVDQYLGRCPCPDHRDDPDAVFLAVREFPMRAWLVRRFAPIRPPSDELTQRIKRCKPTPAPAKPEPVLDDVLGQL